ncbi:hypothetical protein V5E97_06915 [Singulisphaera sp. Ch08]|uniref:Uncharacterized protein n=1 Tax=Singulisphaera sp. Ch08 TaxID=3120278 RepID=A0AAU7CL41_9BACT
MVAVDADAWTIKVGVPPYDLASHNLLAEVRVYLLAPGSGQPGTASEYLDSPYPYAVVDLRESRGGIEVVLPLPEVEPADYFGQIVLLFDDSAVEPEPPSEDAATS